MAVSFPPTISYYNVNSSVHQANFNNAASNGYHMIDISVSGVPPSHRYAAIFVKDSAPPQSWYAKHDMNQAAYEAQSQTYAQQGIIPTWVTVTGSGSNVVFAGIWESKTECTNEVIVNIPQSDLQDTVDSKQPSAISALKEYNTPGDRRYAAIFTSCPYAQHRDWWYTLTDASHKVNLQGEKTKPYWRPISVTGSADNYLSSVYTDTADVGRWDSDTSISASNVASRLQQWKQNALFPIRLQVHGSASAPLYSAIVAEKFPVASRTWRVVSGASSGLQNQASATSSLDSLIRTFMKQGSVRNAQLAVGRGGKLLLERAYTWAEPSRNSTQPADRFLLASISKAFTAAAIQAMYNKNTINPNTKAYTSLGYTKFNDARLASITVQQLLDSTAGYDRDASGLDPAFMGREISLAQSNGARVATLTDTIDFMVKKSLDFNPGDYEAYGNYGYQVLSQIVAKLGGKGSYFASLQANVLTPSSLDVRQWLTAGSAHTGDAINQESTGVGASALTPTTSNPVNLVFGGDNMVKEACEGPSSLAASASTLTRFISKYAVWGNGGRAPGYGRSGSMPGVSSWMFSRDNGLDWALVFNTREFDAEQADTLIDNINAILDQQPSQ